MATEADALFKNSYIFFITKTDLVIYFKTLKKLYVLHICYL
jgi:hypothetical protein